MSGIYTVQVCQGVAAALKTSTCGPYTLHVVTLLFVVFRVKYLITKDILSEPTAKLSLYYNSCRLSQATMQRDHGPAQIKNCIWISVMDKHCMKILS